MYRPLHIDYRLPYVFLVYRLNPVYAFEYESEDQEYVQEYDQHQNDVEGHLEACRAAVGYVTYEIEVTESITDISDVRCVHLPKFYDL